MEKHPACLLVCWCSLVASCGRSCTPSPDRGSQEAMSPRGQCMCGAAALSVAGAAAQAPTPGARTPHEPASCSNRISLSLSLSLPLVHTSSLNLLLMCSCSLSGRRCSQGTHPGSRSAHKPAGRLCTSTRGPCVRCVCLLLSHVLAQSGHVSECICCKGCNPASGPQSPAAACWGPVCTSAIAAELQTQVSSEQPSTLLGLPDSAVLAGPIAAVAG